MLAVGWASLGTGTGEVEDVTTTPDMTRTAVEGREEKTDFRDMKVAA